ncbi:MAG TPA: response regulator [Daejeonella sp.]
MHFKINTILLADDDPDDRDFFKDALKSVSTELVLKTAENGIQALEILENSENLPDLIFLDLNMPLKNGHECLLDIKDNPKTKGIPVIIFSTSLQRETANVMYESGASRYVVKPNSFAELKIVLRELTQLDWKSPFIESKENFVYQY